MQLTYNENPAIGRAGMLADTRIMKHTASRLAAGRIKAGYGVFLVPGYGQAGTRIGDPGQVWQTPTPSHVVDDDAIMLATASNAAGVTYLPAGYNGVHGANVMTPARKVTVVTSAHADFDADADGLVVTYVNQYGVQVAETFATADAGNETFTTAGYVQELVSVAFAADSMSGAGGTVKIGVAVLEATINLQDFIGVAQYDAAKEPFDTVGTDAAEFGDKDTINVLRRGAIWVTTENACVAEGDVFVRIAAGAGGTQLGAFRSDADTATAVQVTGARWGRDSAIGGLNILEMF